MDGLSDLLPRAREASVLDVGCNRGLVSFEFMHHGSPVIHGCDLFKEGIEAARDTFNKANESREMLALEYSNREVGFDRQRYADLRHIEGRFEVVDLTQGPSALKIFGRDYYDIVVMLATYHKLKRVMKPAALSELMRFFGKSTKHYFAWRATSDKPQENEEEMVALDKDLGAAGLQRIQTSYISRTLGVAAIWGRV